MNTPIDPRQGDRRNKALLARLAAMAGKNPNAKALLGKLGQSRGTVRSAGARGTGVRVAQNGAARPGALNFLQAGGFGLGMRGMEPTGGPEMIPEYGPTQLHAQNPMPSRQLDMQAPSAVPSFLGPPMAADNPGDPGYSAPGDGSPPGTPITDPNGRGAGFAHTGGLMGTPAQKLIPLGGGRYLDPTTGLMHGVGGAVLHPAGSGPAVGGRVMFE